VRPPAADGLRARYFKNPCSPFQRRLQVTLHFAELAFQAPGRRSFDVHPEGTEKLKDHDLVAERGYAVAEIRSFRTDVGDGTLDIEFVRRSTTPAFRRSR
jgi:hypothetical protein